MAKILILGGGFSGVVAAECLAKSAGEKHEITLISRSHQFVFYPALVRLAFGQCSEPDIAFDLRDAMLNRRVRFLEGEAARIDPREHLVTFAHGDLVGKMPYDFLVVTLGRRLATERITGFYEHTHHLLGVQAARKFGKALGSFHQGRIVLGHCAGARLPIPIFETAFALSRLLTERRDRNRCRITIVTDAALDDIFAEPSVSALLDHALKSQEIELVPNFIIKEVTKNSVVASNGRVLDCDLRMLVPPFRGPGAALGLGITDHEDYLRVDRTMRVQGIEGVYAAGDCVNFGGPKMGHMAVRQAEVAAENVVAEIEGRKPSGVYDHEMMMVIDTGSTDSIFVHKQLWTDDKADVQQSRFWAWAKRKQEMYWKARHA